MSYKIVKGNYLKSLQEQIEKLNRDIVSATDFIKTIEKGDLNAEYNGDGQDEKSLIHALLSMREQMQVIALREGDRNWVTEGLAKFADILRTKNENIKILSENIISNLVTYLNANQGSFFILNDEDEKDKFLELMACYAYDRKKFAQKRVDIGEGLLGQSFLEKETTYLTQIPENYLSITSGLGEALPRAIIIVPIKVNDVVYGMLEIASFKEFKPHHKEFLEKLGESIASSISSVKISERTQKLLHASQIASEEMKSQEEELRQNMEEMHATQEELARHDAESRSLLTALDSIAIVVEYNLQGDVLKINEKMKSIAGLQGDALIGTNYLAFCQTDEEKLEAKSMWEDLRRGKTITRFRKMTTGKGDIWLQEYYNPIRDRNGDLVRIMGIAIDITETKKQELLLAEKADEMRAQEEELRQNMEEMQTIQEELSLKEAESKSLLTAIDSLAIVAEYDIEGNMLKINDQIEKVLGMPGNNLVGQNYMSFCQTDEEKAEATVMWQNLKQGRSFVKIRKMKLENKNFWLQEYYNPVVDHDGRIQKVYGITIDISDSKRQEDELIQQAEQMKSQEEELRQNMEELHTIQEELSKKAKEIEEVRQLEKQRADSQIEAQKKMMQNFMDKVKQTENDYKAKIATLESKLSGKNKT
ncbi:PAS domain S-box protein [Sporocytophaga myxococcoides]|uniref:PAS domain S-box protein n=1 Tax=Sporocytophaga myxococcoides TaxID=153721 RepID=UPI0003FB428B|nr:PAS domain S-box protein [Sporocytophaga myxococcoides]